MAQYIRQKKTNSIPNSNRKMGKNEPTNVISFMINMKYMTGG